MTDEIRTFDTGATRDSEEGKFDYEGFLSPLVLERYAEYMHSHRMQKGGKLRDSDNWQKGIPFSAYMKSLLRHLMTLWKQHRFPFGPDPSEETLCAIIFNSSGYLHEMLMAKRRVKLGVETEELPAEVGAHADDVTEALDCMPAPTKESLAALGTAKATKAVDQADDPRYVLTMDGWVLPATPAPK